MLAKVERLVEFEETVFEEGPVQLWRLRRENVDIAESPAVRRVEGGDLGPLEKHERARADLSNPLQEGDSAQSSKGGRALLGGKCFRNRLTRRAAALSGERPELMYHYAFDRGVVDERIDFRPDVARPHHLPTKRPRKRASLWVEPNRE
jgi:hypothetical protein